MTSEQIDQELTNSDGLGRDWENSKKVSKIHTVQRFVPVQVSTTIYMYVCERERESYKLDVSMTQLFEYVLEG